MLLSIRASQSFPVEVGRHRPTRFHHPRVLPHHHLRLATRILDRSQSKKVLLNTSFHDHDLLIAAAVFERVPDSGDAAGMP